MKFSYLVYLIVFCIFTQAQLVMAKSITFPSVEGRLNMVGDNSYDLSGFSLEIRYRCMTTNMRSWPFSIPSKFEKSFQPCQKLKIVTIPVSTSGAYKIKSINFNVKRNYRVEMSILLFHHSQNKYRQLVQYKRESFGAKSSLRSRNSKYFEDDMTLINLYRFNQEVVEVSSLSGRNFDQILRDDFTNNRFPFIHFKHFVEVKYPEARGYYSTRETDGIPARYFCQFGLSYKEPDGEKRIGYRFIYDAITQEIKAPAKRFYDSGRDKFQLTLPECIIPRIIGNKGNTKKRRSNQFTFAVLFNTQNLSRRLGDQNWLHYKSNYKYGVYPDQVKVLNFGKL